MRGHEAFAAMLEIIAPPEVVQAVWRMRRAHAAVRATCAICERSLRRGSCAICERSLRRGSCAICERSLRPRHRGR